MATIHIPENAEVMDAFMTAQKSGMRLFIDGKRAVIAREKPSKGIWAEVKAGVVNAKLAHLRKVAPCAA